MLTEPPTDGGRDVCREPQLAGFALLMGRVWARTIGVVLAAISALVGFAWLPWYPIWGVIFITSAVFVIWALTVHGRDVTKYT